MSMHEVRAEASYIHDFYTSVENLFRVVAEEFNGGLPSGQLWHKTLLLEMKEPVPGVRKPLVSTALFTMLDECLRFRHFVRNSYGIFLENAQTRKVSALAKKAYRQLIKEIGSFVEQ